MTFEFALFVFDWWHKAFYIPFWLEIYTEERIPAATFCLGSDGLRYEGKLRFRPLNADLLAALEPLAEQWEQEHKNGGDG